MPGMRCRPTRSTSSLELSAEAAEGFRSDADRLLRNYFDLEDPNEVNPVGIELTLEARVGAMRLRGIIDRLDLTPDGELVVIDYKTGRAPSPGFEHSKLIGVHIYALLCQEVIGRPPGGGQTAPPQRAHRHHLRTLRAGAPRTAVKAMAVWSAIERACENEDFRPRPSPLCNFCRFQAFCPAFGGNPADAAVALGGAVGGAA